ncbi:MAG: chemotaxis protein CheA [Candidatus Lokiarchaeota archaeon]|nr:chemotaxis protein CheA [Candidatus Lokiarchaeota archaeon]
MSISKDDLNLFISEAEDLIQKIEDEIFKLEKNPNETKPKQELYFAFHTLKGLTAMAGLDRASKFCHIFESFLDKSKEEEIAGNQQDTFIGLLFDSLDLLRSILKRVKKGDLSDIDEKFLNSIKESFDEFESGGSELEVSIVSIIPPSDVKKLLSDKKNKFYRIYIRLQPTCVFKKVRLFIISRALNDMGKIFFSKPHPEVLESGDFNIDFEFFFLSQKIDSDILKVLDEILEIENKVVSELQNKDVEVIFNKDIPSWKEARKKQAVTLSSSGVPKEKTRSDFESRSTIVESFQEETEKIASVKVDINILENLMNYFGEIVILKNQINQMLKERGLVDLNHLFDELDKPFMEVQEIIFKLKLVRVESTFRKYRRLVRDVAREQKKKVDFILEGTNVEIDRKILEEINSPLIHLLRNAIYHGLENPAERKKKGKDESGSLMLATSRRAGLIYIQVIDDGGGINYDKIREKIVEKKIYSKEDAEKLSVEELNMMILLPGFSILSDANQISGRGMGLAIVADKMKQLGGSFTIHSEKDKGSTFTLIVPFTRAILNAQLIKVAGDLFAIPTENINQIYLYDRGLVESVGDEDYFKIENDLIPIIYLNEYLGISNQNQEYNGSSKTAVWIKKDEQVSAVFVIDEILQQMNLVVKPFKFNFSDFYDILGSTIMSDGSICLVLDVLSIIDTNITPDKFTKLTSIQ